MATDTRSKEDLRQMLGALSKELADKQKADGAEGDTDIHKAPNPNLHAQIPFPALVHRARLVKKPVDLNGQTFSKKEISDAKGAIEIVAEAELVEFQHVKVEDADEQALKLKQGWFKTPAEAEAYVRARSARQQAPPAAKDQAQPSKE